MLQLDLVVPCVPTVNFSSNISVKRFSKFCLDHSSLICFELVLAWFYLVFERSEALVLLQLDLVVPSLARVNFSSP